MNTSGADAACLNRLANSPRLRLLAFHFAISRGLSSCPISDSGFHERTDGIPLIHNIKAFGLLESAAYGE